MLLEILIAFQSTINHQCSDGDNSSHWRTTTGAPTIVVAVVVNPSQPANPVAGTTVETVIGTVATVKVPGRIELTAAAAAVISS
jgi:hypothetical protein